MQLFSSRIPCVANNLRITLKLKNGRTVYKFIYPDEFKVNIKLKCGAWEKFAGMRFTIQNGGISDTMHGENANIIFSSNEKLVPQIYVQSESAIKHDRDLALALALSMVVDGPLPETKERIDGFISFTILSRKGGVFS